MKFLGTPLNTEDFPSTFTILNHSLPCIFDSRCFNENYLPFSQEVKNTELGHLFEHILLEYLSSIKFKKEEKETVFSGTTQWDFGRLGYGVFIITINTRIKKAQLFKEALQKSILLLEKIIQSNIATEKLPLPPKEILSTQAGVFR